MSPPPSLISYVSNEPFDVEVVLFNPLGIPLLLQGIALSTEVTIQNTHTTHTTQNTHTHTHTHTAHTTLYI